MRKGRMQGEEIEDIEEEPAVPGEDEQPPFGPGSAPPEKPPSSQGKHARARRAPGGGARRGAKRRR